MQSISLMIKPVSGRCNMRCTYCFYADELRHRPSGCHGLMTDEVLEKVVRSAFASSDGPVSFAFQGGEPTLAGAAFFQRFLALEEKYNGRHLPVTHALQTNGLLVGELLEVLKKGRFLVGLSLDGTPAIHDSRRIDAEGRGTYERANAAAQTMRVAGIPYNILCVVDNEIAQQPEACYQALRPHGYIQYIACLEPFGQADTVLSPRLYGDFLIRTFRCYANDFRKGRYVSVRHFDNWISMLCGYPPEQCGMSGHCSVNYLVESNGDVFPCDFYALDQWRLGNILQSGFHRMQHSDVAKAFVAGSLTVSEACAACPWHSLCRGGCRRDRERAGLPDAAADNRLCESYRMFFEACYPELKQLALLPSPKSPTQRA